MDPDSLGDGELHAVLPTHGELHPRVDPHAGPPVPSLVLDGPEGPRPLGAPTVDSDADGVADTTVTTYGPLELATDLDADGHADVLTTVAADGTAHTVVRGPDGHWSPIEPHRPSGTPGTGSADPWDEGTPPPPSTLDPATGAWIRSI